MIITANSQTALPYRVPSPECKRYTSAAAKFPTWVSPFHWHHNWDISQTYYDIGSDEFWVLTITIYNAPSALQSCKIILKQLCDGKK